MLKIYEQHSAAFSRVGAYAVLDQGLVVATIAFKFQADGAGRLYAYVHWLGLDMVRGHAAGGGYDKRSAACAHAMKSAPLGLDAATGTRADPAGHWNAFRAALAANEGQTWDNALWLAGFPVFRAV